MLKVMIVDDDANVRKCLRKLIPWTEIGCTVTAEASDGLEGLKLFHEQKPDVIITDLKMPEMGGEKFCEKIRAVSDNTSIIFLSAYESFTAARQSLRYGVTEYILKPINAQTLNQITEILKNLSSSLQSRSFMARLIGDPSFQEEFTAQLRCRNTSYFDGFFEKFSAGPWNDFTLLQRNAMFLLNLLFDVSDADHSSERLFSRRQESLSELSALTRKMDILNYVTESYTLYLTRQSLSAPDSFGSRLAEEIKLYILKNLGDSGLSVSSIADSFGFSDDYLGRIFKKAAGVSINAHITHTRLNHACRLLINTRLSVAEIALSTGYSSTNYFCRSFKKQLGVTPTDYQRRESCTGQRQTGQ